MAKGVVAHALDVAGNPVALEEQQLSDARDAGFKPISASEASQRAQAEQDAQYVEKNYGTAGNLALGAASGLTLGIGPALAAQAGLIDTGHLQASQQTGAFTGGDIAGTLLPAFLSGGTGTVGRALAKTPAGLLMEAGGLAERAVGRFLPEAGILGKTAAGSIKMAARGATEGALMNVAHTASQDIIQNKPLTAQALLASAEDGALFGGLAGGILGGGAALAGAGVESIGGRALSAVGQGAGGQRSAGVALKRLGVEADTALARGGENRFTGALREYTEVIQKGETSLSAKTSHIHAAMKAVAEESQIAADTALKELGQIAKPGIAPKVALFDRFDKEFTVMYKGTADQRPASIIYRELRRDLAKANTWEHWAYNRERLARDVASASGLKKDIFKSALNALDDEFRIAGEAVDEGLFKQYSAATIQRRVAEELVDGTSKKLTSEAQRGNPLHLTGTDAATLGFGTVGGIPMAAAGVVAGKRLAAYAQDKLEPIIAEYAARSALGSAAGAATANVGNSLSGALKRFMSGTAKAARVSTEKAHSESYTKAKKVSYSLKSYQENMDLAEKLTSAAHQAKVREYTQALAMAGHEDLANEMQLTYGRAVAYVNQNVPKSGKDQGAGKLGKPPVPLGLDTEGWKFMRQMHGLKNPVGAIVSGLDDGSLSQDTVAAIKYVMPDLHQDLVYRASMAAMEMKAEGKFLPADKLVTLGLALDYPVDSTLQKDFIDEVQAAHAVNHKPAQESGPSGPPPITDISSYQTPLQKSV